MTEQITELIQTNTPFIFAKFGDGEYFAAVGEPGHNCDKDPYTEKKRTGLHDAFRYYSNLENSYIGYWPHNKKMVAYFESIVEKPVRWIDYHTIIMNQGSCANPNKLILYKSVKECSRKKILVGHALLVKAKHLFNLDAHIIVPFHGWFEDEFDRVYQEILDTCDGIDNPLIITSAGMGSKILIMELHKKMPNGMYIDFGSALDVLCTKRCSRGQGISYEQIENYFRPILPENWNDPCFDCIYPEARQKLGVHLG